MPDGTSWLTAAVRTLRSSPAQVIAAALTVLALLSAWHSGGHVWRLLESDYRTYSAYTPTQRQHAALDAIPVNSDYFDYYATYVQRGDRIYFQVPPGGLGEFFDLPSAVAAAGRFYLLPAVQADSLSDATVVVSYEDDPALLHLSYVTQQRAGLQLVFVSRIAGP
jgi:hypothetical protein